MIPCMSIHLNKISPLYQVFSHSWVQQTADGQYLGELNYISFHLYVLFTSQYSLNGIIQRFLTQYVHPSYQASYIIYE